METEQKRVLETSRMHSTMIMILVDSLLPEFTDKKPPQNAFFFYSNLKGFPYQCEIYLNYFLKGITIFNPNRNYKKALSQNSVFRSLLSHIAKNHSSRHSVL